MNRPVLIAAGGTGGHVIPALAVADVLREQDIPVIWLGTRSGIEARLVPSAGIDIRWISVAGLRGKTMFQTLLGPLKLLRSCVQSLALVYSLKPRAVLGMGGFVSGPVGIAALLMRKPLVLHEQNAVAGMTNRYLSGWASRVFTAWPGAFAAKVNARVVGNPISADVATMSAREPATSLDTSTPLKILVVGGSRGARALNEIVPEAVARFDAPVCVLHQAGLQEIDDVRQRYSNADKASVEVAGFIDNMADAYQNADVVICRSGAMTVTELSALGVPSILVPFPYAVDDHQTLNARHLAEAGAAILMPQMTLSPDSLQHVLQRLTNNRTELKSMSEAARQCFSPRAAEVVAQAIVEVSH